MVLCKEHIKSGDTALHQYRSFISIPSTPNHLKHSSIISDNALCSFDNVGNIFFLRMWG
jgi:hypothetical protein